MRRAANAESVRKRLVVAGVFAGATAAALAAAPGDQRAAAVAFRLGLAYAVDKTLQAPLTHLPRYTWQSTFEGAVHVGVRLFRSAAA